MNNIQEFYHVLEVEKGSKEDSSFAQVLAQLTPTPGGRLLDIGCLDGAKTVLIQDVLDCDEVYGIDFLPSSLAEAERQGIRTACVDLNHDLPLSFPDDHFDMIFCGEVIEHVFSPDELMDEIARLLKPGGYALITTPNLASWKNRLVFLFGWQPFYTEVSTRARFGNPLAPPGLPSGHIRMFVPRALKELAEASGLHVEVVDGLFFPNPTGQFIVGGISNKIDTLMARHWPTLADRTMLRLRKAKG